MQSNLMRQNLKQWRDSASVILVAKTSFSPAPANTNNNGGQCTKNGDLCNNNSGADKKGSSRYGGNREDFNYKLLTIKRSSSTGFMPGTYVFPGGNVEPADGTRDWLRLYERFGFPNESFAKLNVAADRPPIFQNTPDGEIPRFLSLRIGAIRETFEECGILICRSYHMNYKERIARWASFIGGPEVKKWQDRVHDDPSQFIALCSEFEVYPDVWALKEWSNWVTPVQLKQRFDTVFFIAAFHQLPVAQAEKKEVQTLEWAAPSDLLARNESELIGLPPPQYYELCRLRNFSDIEQLARFAADRATAGIERYYPLRISTDEGMFSVLPGDDLYQQNSDVDVTKVDMPHIPKMPNSDVQNRIYHKELFTNRVFTRNFVPKFKQVAPLCPPTAIRTTTTSKL